MMKWVHDKTIFAPVVCAADPRRVLRVHVTTTTQHEARGSDPLAEARRAAGQNSRTAAEPPIDVIAFLKPRLKTSSAQQSARATDMLVRNATSETSGIASSTGRRRARSRRRRCRYAHFHYVMWRHLVKYSSARV